MVLVLAETIKLEKLLDSGDQLFEVNNRIKRLETELLAANAERNQLLKRVNGRVSKTSKIPPCILLEGKTIGKP